MKTISQLFLKDQAILLLYHKKELGYTMEIDGKSYGTKVELPSRKVQDVASATMLLLINALDTMDSLKNNAS